MKLVLFDFDGTLTRRDSYLPFLRYMFGTPRFLAGLMMNSGHLLAYGLGLLPNDEAKTRMMRHFLAGLPLDRVSDTGEAFACQALPDLLRPSMIERLKAHVVAGDTCVLVSASLDVYLRPWARLHGFSKVLCTSLATDDEQCVTGELKPANCYGQEKVRRIKEWLNGIKPDTITAYGDSDGDNEMFLMADISYRVTKNSLKQI